jgi:hypothetical protein
MKKEEKSISFIVTFQFGEATIKWLEDKAEILLYFQEEHKVQIMYTLFESSCVIKENYFIIPYSGNEDGIIDFLSEIGLKTPYIIPIEIDNHCIASMI